MKYAAVFLAFAVGLASAQSPTGEGFQRPSAAPQPGGVSSHGCYNASSTTWKRYAVDDISVGTCTGYCQNTVKKNVAALNGEDCYCGDMYPPKNSLDSDSKCNYPCPYYRPEACGGIDGGKYYSVYNMGIKLVVSNDEPATSSVSSSAKPTSTTSAGGAVETIVETPTPTPTPTEDADEDKKKSGGSNVAGIAAGVVVGVVAIAAIVGLAFFFIRRKRNQEIEEEHRRNAAVNAFIGGKPPSSSGNSMSDSRMDPTLAHRRMSDGSIADNQDYSRKILRVTNA